MTTSTQPTKFIRARQVAPLYGTALSKLYADVADGLVTKPIRISHRVALWPEQEIVAINTARLVGRSKDEMRELVRRLHEQRQIDAKTLGV